MRARVLIAGLGNVNFADDGFGVEVARHVLRSALPLGAAAEEFGVRGLHLARALMRPVELLVVPEIARLDGAPGTLYLIDPLSDPRPIGASEGHAVDLPLVLAAVRAFGAAPPRVLIVGCEPADLSARVGLSEPVRRAVAPAVELVHRLVARELARVGQLDGQLN